MRPYFSRPGFTLVELLVVLGIIATLIGILLPVINKAREAGNAAVCRSNLRQVGTAIVRYRAENYNTLSTDYASLFPTKANIGGLGGKNTFQFRYCPTWINVSSSVNDANVDSSSWGGSYGYNPWITSAAGAIAPTPYRPNFKNSAELAMIADVMLTDSTGLQYVGATSLADSFGADRAAAAGLKLWRPSFQGRHAGRGNVLWADGHVSSEMPTPVPEIASSNFTGTAAAQPPSFYNKHRIGYLVPAGVDVRTYAAEYYFFAKKSRLNVTSGNDWFRAVILTSGVVWYPKIEDWK